jgi:hypothetical protein
MKDTVDQAILSHFDGNYFQAHLTDSEHGVILLIAPSMTEVKRYLDWVKQQPGVARAEVYIVMEYITMYDKLAEMTTKPLATVAVAS